LISDDRVRLVGWIMVFAWCQTGVPSGDSVVATVYYVRRLPRGGALHPPLLDNNLSIHNNVYRM
jgi:hypothetical protein